MSEAPPEDFSGHIPGGVGNGLLGMLGGKTRPDELTSLHSGNKYLISSSAGLELTELGSDKREVVGAAGDLPPGKWILESNLTGLWTIKNFDTNRYLGLGVGELKNGTFLEASVLPVLWNLHEDEQEQKPSSGGQGSWRSYHISIPDHVLNLSVELEAPKSPIDKPKAHLAIKEDKKPQQMWTFVSLDIGKYEGPEFSVDPQRPRSEWG